MVQCKSHLQITRAFIKSCCVLSKSGIRDLDVWLKIPSGTEESEAVAVAAAAAFSVELYEEEVRPAGGPSVGRG